MKHEIPCPLCKNSNINLHFEREDKRYGKRIYLACPQCKLVFLEPDLRLAPDEEEARYNTHQNHPGDQGYVDFLNRLANPLSLRLEPGMRGLDYGCGPGPTLSVILNQKGFSVENYDPFFFPNQDLLQKTYDFIACTEVIEHFYHPRKEFLLFQNLLKIKGGILGLMTEILEPHQAFETWWYHRDPTHVCFYRRATFEWIARWLKWSVTFPKKNVAIFSNDAASLESFEV